jgi:putative transposase
MKAQEDRHSIAMMSRVLEVSRSGFYAWAGRRPSRRGREDSELGQRIQNIHEESWGTYGAPRIHTELADSGTHVGRKGVARLMRGNGIRGVCRRKWTTTTVRDRAAVVAPDLVKRHFLAHGLNQLWVADITYIPTWAGFLYVAVVLDVWSRQVVGWAFALHLRVELVLAALEMAVRCRQPGIRPTMGSVGDAYNNAMCESFFATLECELIDRYQLRTPAEAETAVFEFIEGWYNSRRRHSALDMMSPIEYKSSCLGVTQDTSPDLSTETG